MSTPEQRAYYAAAMRRWRAANPARAKEAVRRWRAAHSEKSRASTAAWRAAHPEHLARYRAEIYAADVKKARARADAWKRAHPERLKATQAAYRAANRDSIAAWKAAYYRAHKVTINDKRAHVRRAQKYGVTREQFDSLRRSQAGLCAICRVALAGALGTHVDHDHKTGRVRGLLCNACNRGLGMFRDNAVNLRNAAIYVESIL